MLSSVVSRHVGSDTTGRQVVRMAAYRTMLEGISASARVVADLLVNAAVIEGQAEASTCPVSNSRLLVDFSYDCEHRVHHPP
jgi:hypothetical protein